MTHEEAHKILDAVRNGVPHPAAYISKALHLTGDLGAKYGSTMAIRVERFIAAQDFNSEIANHPDKRIQKIF